MQPVQAPVIELHDVHGDEQTTVELLEDEVLKLDISKELETLIPAIKFEVREEFRT